MGSKGNHQTTATSQTQSYQADPRIQASGELAMNQAIGAAQQPFQMPTAPVAPFNPFQEQAFGQVQGAQGMTDPYFAAARSYIDQSASPLTGGTVNQYFNPMTDAVTAQLQNIFGQQNKQATGKAVQAAGGVGADRIGVAQGNLANQQTLGAGQVYSQLYQQAVQNAQADKARQQAAGYAMGQLGPAAQAANLQATSALGGAGNQQQQQQQQQLNAPYQNILAQIAYPFQTSQFLAGITGGLAPAFGGTTSGTGTSQTTLPTPSPLSQILGVGTAGLGLAGGLGAFGGSGKGSNPAVPGATSVVGGAGLQPVPTFFRRGGPVNPFADGGSVDDSQDLMAMLADYYKTASARAPQFTPPAGGRQLTPLWSLPSQQPQQAQPQDGLTPLQRLMGNRFNPPPAMASPPEPQRKPGQTAGEAQQDYNNVGAARGGIIYRADGGASDEDSEGTPPIPGITIPRSGGMSPIPYTPLKSGSGEFHNRLDLSPPRQQSSGGGKGSGVGDVARLATTVLPFLLARGGAVNPYDHFQPMQEGGDAEFDPGESWDPEPLQGIDAPMGNTNPHWTMGDVAGRARDYYGNPFDKVAPVNKESAWNVGKYVRPEEIDVEPSKSPVTPFKGETAYDYPQEQPKLAAGEVPMTMEDPFSGKAPLPRGNPRNVGGIKSTMANELSSAGASPTAISGINMNVRDESKFRYGDDSVHYDQPNPRFRGTEAQNAHGLYQEGGDEWNNYQAWLKKKHPDADWRDPSLQTRFLAENLKENYPDVWERMNNAKTPGEAADAFLRGYLKPAGQHIASRSRRYLGGEGDEGTELSARERNPFAANRDMKVGDYHLPKRDQPYPDALARDWGQKLTRSPWMSLVAAGAKMASTTGPIGSAIGQGIAAGAGALDNQRKELRTEQDHNLKADQLFQQAQIHLDKYQRMTPYEQSRVEAEKYQWQSGMGVDPDTGKQVPGVWRLPTKSGEEPEFRPGMALSGKGSQSEALWKVKREAWLGLHPGDEAGALEYAAGRRQIPESQLKVSAERAAAAELKENPSLNKQERYRYWVDQFSTKDGGPGSSENNPIAVLPEESKRIPGKWYFDPETKKARKWY